MVQKWSHWPKRAGIGDPKHLASRFSTDKPHVGDPEAAQFLTAHAAIRQVQPPDEPGSAAGLAEWELTHGRGMWMPEMLSDDGAKMLGALYFEKTPIVYGTEPWPAVRVESRIRVLTTEPKP
jgi:hypothetical protein